MSVGRPERGRTRGLGTAGLLAAVVAAACGRGVRDEGLVASGHVEATDVRIASKLPGRVASIAVREGDRAREGQELAAIDATEARLAAAAARAERSQADAELRLRLAGARKEDLAEARAELASVQAELAGAETDLARMQGLLDRGSGTVKARDDARTRRDVLAGRARSGNERLARLRAGSRTEELDAARARVDAAEARIAIADQQVKDASVTSPIDGVVTHRLVEPGELVGAGAPLLVLTDLAHAWLSVYVPEPDLGRVRVGAAVEATTDAGEQRSGRVTYVSSEAEFTPKNVQTRDERVKLVFKAKVSLENADGLFKPGMPATARLVPSAGAAEGEAAGSRR